MSLGSVRVPIDSLEFRHRRQINLKVRKRLERVLKNLYRVGATEVRIPCTVEEGKFRQILAHLGLSADQLRRTREKGQKDLPLLTGIRLSCLYGDYTVAAAKGNKETTLIVHIFSADLLDPLLELISTFSHEPPQSDGELYQKIIESYRRDEVTYALCMSSLTGPKERNMKMLLRPKNFAIVQAINSLVKIPAMMEQFLLGNIHKWLALHIDEQIITYLNHISVVWKERICERKEIFMQSLDIDSIRMVQFRMPTTCSGDAETIKRLFDNGTLFPGVIDPSDRDMLRRNVLSLDTVIPSFETFQANMHYIGFAAKILIRHVIDELPLCKSSKTRSPTIFEVLSSNWTAPEVVKVEFDDFDMREIEGPASPSLAFTQLCLACLRLFPWLQDALPPREDWPQDSFRADVDMKCVAYVLRLAYEVGFRTSKIQAALSQPVVYYSGPKPPFLWQEVKVWRGGRPFTRTFWYFRANGFLPRLASIRRRQPNPEFVLLDMVKAFFGEHTTILKDVLEHQIAVARPEDTHMEGDFGEESALGPEEDTHMEGDFGEESALAWRKIRTWRARPRLPLVVRGTRSDQDPVTDGLQKKRRNKTTSITAKTPRQDAVGISGLEAAGSGIRRPANIHRVARIAAGRSGVASLKQGKEQGKRDAVLWDKPVAPVLPDGVKEDGGPSVQPNPLPVVVEVEEEEL